MRIIKKDINFTEKDLLKNYKIGPYQGWSKSDIYISNDSKSLIKTNISNKELNNLILFNKTVDEKIKKYFLHDIDVYILHNKKIYFKMIYINSETLRFTIINLKIDEIYDIYMKLFKIIIYLNHKHKIYINDIHLDNIIYSNKKIYIIDFLEYITLNKVNNFSYKLNNNLNFLKYNKMFDKSELFYILIRIFHQFIIINNRITKIRYTYQNKIKKKRIHIIQILNISIKNKKIKNIYELDIILYNFIKKRKNFIKIFSKI